MEGQVGLQTTGEVKGVAAGALVCFVESCRLTEGVLYSGCSAREGRLTPAAMG